MKIFKKNVKYFKFFEDIKIIEHDSDNYRLGVVFYGKENDIYIFDSKPYINYFPIIEDISNKNFKNSNLENENIIKNKLNVSNTTIDTELNQMFLKVQLNFNDYTLNKTNPKIIDEQGQHCIIYNNYFNNTLNKQKKKKLSKKNEINLGSYEITRFTISYIPEIKIKKAVILSYIKPKIKNKLLSVLSLNNNSILGIKWFTFFKKQNNKIEIENSKLLLVITDDGIIGIYKLSNINYQNNITINTIDITSLQRQPFNNFLENWILIANNAITLPIKDFYLLTTSYIEEKREFIKLYTLHINNGIYFWGIILENNKVNIIPSFSLIFEETFKIEHILIDKKELFLICFNKNGIEIFQMAQTPPFNILYKFFYEDSKIENYSSVEFDSEIDCDIINADGKVFVDDIKDFQDLKKPKFICLEKKILFQVYNAIDGSYNLLYFNLEGLFKVFKDLIFFKSCTLGNDKTLLKKIFNSKINFSFCVSPSLYYNVDEYKSVENNFLKKKNIKKNNLIDNLNQIINIQTNNMNFFIKIPVLSEINEITEKISPIVLEQENEEYKPILLWINNNSILITSEKFLFTLIKFCKETEDLGIPVSENLLVKLFDL